MTEDQIKTLQETIAVQIDSTIQRVVNGKIDRINLKLDDYIVSDLKWKDKVQPDIDSVANAKAWGKITMGILTVGGVVLGVIYEIYSIAMKK